MANSKELKQNQQLIDAASGCLIYKPKDIKHPDYATKEARYISFVHWQYGHIVKEDRLVDSGFYHTGTRDETVCYWCDMMLRFWKPGDDPIAEHRKKSPACGHLVLCQIKMSGITAEPSDDNDISLDFMSVKPAEEQAVQLPVEPIKKDKPEPLTGQFKSEYNRMKKKNTCVDCSRTRSMLFLPCAHLVTCGQCAILCAITCKCPLCQDEIKGMIKLL